ncbi:MAG: exosortase/archaeosortase family protein [Paludibacteraceae bacterium]|nr:exosortase/archaeosortase family protein [Paludibacteraceae bacterium]
MKCPTLKQKYRQTSKDERQKTPGPYADILIFVVTMLVANYLWKFTVIGDETGTDNMVLWFGWDITTPFEVMSRHIVACVYWLVSQVRDTVELRNGHTVGFVGGAGTAIVWSCSGLKQLFIWLCIMLTARGGWKHKLWFIPLGAVNCHAFNILRIAIITLFLEHHPDWFTVLHDYIFKYLFYGLMFLLWVWFVERYGKRSMAE